MESGFLGTHVTRDGKLCNTFYPDCGVLCRQGEDGLLLICGEVALQYFLDKIFKRKSVSIRPKFVFIEFSSALGKGLNLVYPNAKQIRYVLFPCIQFLKYFHVSCFGSMLLIWAVL